MAYLAGLFGFAIGFVAAFAIGFWFMGEELGSSQAHVGDAHASEMWSNGR